MRGLGRAWPLFLCVGCATGGGVVHAPGDKADSAAGDTAPADSGGSSGPGDSSGDSTGEGTFRLDAPAAVPLPYVTTGEAVPDGVLTVSATGAGSVGGVRVTVTGPFTVTLDGAPLAEGERRSGVVTYTGSVAAPAITTGTATVNVDDQAVDIELVAVIGDPAIGRATWTADAWGRCTTLDLPSAPFPDGHATYDDASVRICVPTGLSDRGALAAVVHFHGFGATIDEVDEYQHLHAQAALSGRDSVFVLPQGPVNASDGDFGKLDEADGLAHLLRDVRSVLYRDDVITRPDPGAVAVTSHSGGYNVTANVIEVGGEPVGAVHLFDSVYGRSSTFEAFAQDGGVLRSSYTDGGGTDDENRALAAALTRDGLDVRDDLYESTLRASPDSIAFIDAAHGDCLHWDLSYARWLAASGLPHNPGSPPELLSTRSDGGEARVAWRAVAGQPGAEDPGPGDPVVVEGSDDGATWVDLVTTTDDHATVPSHPYLRLRTAVAGLDRSPPSDTYGATGGDWLVVDGFDRLFGGSWTEPTHPFAAGLGVALGAGFSVADHEAVAEGSVRLTDYAHVLWMLGDESTADRTFDAREQAAIEAYVAAGGALVVSGSEVGYASGSWLSTALHARYVADSAGTDRVGSWTLGAVYPEDYPDVLSGDEVLWTYATGGAAAVGWDRRVVVIGFALETLDDVDRADALADVRAWLGG